jgi:hypothetical protein
VLLQLVLSFFTDKVVFNISHLQDLISGPNGMRYIGLKVALAVILLIFWEITTYIITWYRQKDFARTMGKYALIYLAIMSVFFVFLWPGIFRWDEFFILYDVLALNYNYWQHAITSMVYILSLMVIPTTGGIVMVQLIFISLVVGFVMSVIKDLFKGIKGYQLAFLLFLLPPIIDNNFYPMRTTPYAYLELFFVFYLLRKKIIMKDDFRWREILGLSFIIAILACWRTESIYYLIYGPLVLVMPFRKKIPIYKALVLMCSVVCLFSWFSNIQSTGVKENDKSYQLTAIINPLSMMLQEDIEDQDLLGNIDRVMSVDILRDNPSAFGINAFYVEGLIRYGYSQEDYEQMMKSYAKLIYKYPKAFLKARAYTFYATCGQIPDQRINIFDASSMYDLDQDGAYANETYQHFAERKNAKPLLPRIRKNLIRILECRNLEDITGASPLYGVFYNLMPITAGLFLMTIFYGIKKNTLFMLIVLSFIGKTGLIFLTAPARLFMYYFPMYVNGNILLCITILGVWYEYRKKEICPLFE